MFITKTKTKETTIYYLSKSFRDKTTNKVSTKIVEKLGTEDDIKKKIGKNKNVSKWLKDYAIKKTQEEKNSVEKINISLDPQKKLSNKNKRIYNAGYLIMKKICYELGLDKICEEIKQKEKFKGDLFQILTYIIYTYNVIEGKNVNTISYSQNFLEKSNFNKRQFFLALEIFAKYSYKIQYELLDTINRITNSDKSYAFYETNTFFNDFINIDEDLDNNKEDDKIIKYEVGYNENMIPIAYSTYKKKGDYDEYDKKNGQRLITEYANSVFYVLSSFDNPYNSQIIAELQEQAKPIEWINIRNLNKELQQWATDNDGWMEVNSKKSFTMDDIKNKINNPDNVIKNNNWLQYARFYKTKKITWIDPKTKEKSNKILVSIFSNQIKEESIQLNKLRIENINRTINKELFKHKNDKKYCLNYLKKYEKYIDIIEDKINMEKTNILHCYNFKNEMLSNYSKFSGYYLIMLDANVENLHEIIKAQSNKWVNDYAFMTVGHDLLALPNYIKYEKRVDAHLFLTFIGLLVWNIYKYKTNSKFYDYQIREALLDFNFIYISGEGWIPAYEISDINKSFQKLLNCDMDHEFITIREMNKIIRLIKSKN